MADYRTITLGRGEKRVYHLDDGETFENVLIDQTADGALFTINARNTRNWTVRNVGWKGRGDPADSGAGRFHMNVGVARGSEGVVENIYMDNMYGGVRGTEVGGGRTQNSHAGTLRWRHAFVRGMGNNACYASGAGKNNGGGGRVIFENCYHRDCTASLYRIGTPNSVVRNCVGIADDPDGRRGGYPGTNSKGTRGVWGEDAPDMLVENSAFHMARRDVNANAAIEARCISKGDWNRAEVTVRDTGINAAQRFRENSRDCKATIFQAGNHTDPSVSVLQDGGVPLSPEMAARGERAMPPEIGDPVSFPDTTAVVTNGSGPEIPDDTQILTLVGGDSSRKEYEITTTGPVEQTTDYDATIFEDGADITGLAGGRYLVESFLRAGRDSYRIEGAVEAFTTEKPSAVSFLRNGEEIDADAVVDAEPDEPDPDPEPPDDEDEEPDDDEPLPSTKSKMRELLDRMDEQEITIPIVGGKLRFRVRGDHFEYVPDDEDGDPDVEVETDGYGSAHGESYGRR